MQVYLYFRQSQGKLIFVKYNNIVGILFKVIGFI